MEDIHKKWCEIAYKNGYDEYWYEEQDLDGQWCESLIKKEPSVEYFEYWLCPSFTRHNHLGMPATRVSLVIRTDPLY